MKKTILLFWAFLISVGVSFAQNQAPTISNLIADVDYSNNQITLTFDLEDNENDNVEITLRASADNGQTFAVNTASTTGDVGYPITPGSNKQIVWTADDLNSNLRIQLVANDLQPVDIQSLVDQVDSARLWDDLTTLQGVRHRNAGPDLLQATRDLMEQTYIDHNLEVSIQDVPLDLYTGKNIIGRLPGVGDESKVYILDGHYDSVSSSPGADDNATAVAGVLEGVRILSNYQFKHSIRFIGFDLEEEGLRGSIEYQQNGILPFETVEGVVNLEMIGYFDNNANTQQFPFGFDILFPDAQAALVADSFRGNFITNVSLEAFNDLGIAFHTAANTYVPDLKVIDIVNPNGLPIPDLLRSDHAPFWTGNIPAIMLTDGADFRNPYYHTSEDTQDKLDQTFMTNVVKAAIATIAELAEVQNSTSAFVEVLSSDETLNCEWNIHPNPANDFLKVTFGDCFSKPVFVEIFDLSGNVVFEKNMNPANGNVQKIDTRNFTTGIYFLKINIRNQIVTKKILIAHQ